MLSFALVCTCLAATKAVGQKKWNILRIMVEAWNNLRSLRISNHSSSTFELFQDVPSSRWSCRLLWMLCAGWPKRLWITCTVLPARHLFWLGATRPEAAQRCRWWWCSSRVLDGSPKDGTGKRFVGRAWGLAFDIFWSKDVSFRSGWFGCRLHLCWGACLVCHMVSWCTWEVVWGSGSWFEVCLRFECFPDEEHNQTLASGGLDVAGMKRWKAEWVRKNFVSFKQIQALELNCWDVEK